jgi:hypothetical protein
MPHPLHISGFITAYKPLYIDIDPDGHFGAQAPQATQPLMICALFLFFLDDESVSGKLTLTIFPSGAIYRSIVSISLKIIIFFIFYSFIFCGILIEEGHFFWYNSLYFI